jgi:hypothetical protein
LIDAIDFVAWLRELGDEVASTEGQLLVESGTRPKVMPQIPSQARWDATCPRCWPRPRRRGGVRQGDGRRRNLQV